jgi:hypothetical protein
MKIRKFNEEYTHPPFTDKNIRIERRENNTYAFVEGGSSDSKEISITPEQRKAIEEILNKK